MPRVGSSNTTTSQSRCSHLASTTFCWLPPDSVSTIASGPGILIRSRSTYVPNALRSAASETKLTRENRSRFGRPKFAREVWPSTSPWPLRSSVSRPMPARIASRGCPSRNCTPSNSTEPRSRRSAPNSRRTVSVRPAPTRPVMARISPARTENDTSRTAEPLVRPFTIRRTGPAGTSRAGNSLSSLRPTIISIRASRSTSATARVATWAPSRMTITRPAMLNISSSRWLM